MDCVRVKKPADRQACQDKKNFPEFGALRDTAGEMHLIRVCRIQPYNNSHFGKSY